MREQRAIIYTLKKRAFGRNRGRNLAAVLAIFLTTMMFTTLFTLAQSLTLNMEKMYLRQSGTTAHATTKQITDAQIDRIAGHEAIVTYGKSIVIGLAENGQLAGRQVEIRYASDQYAKDSFAYPTTGKMPENKNEIALDTLTLERLGLPLELGQTVTLEWRKDQTSPETTSSTFTLCGWWEGNLSVYASMAWTSEAFALEACDHTATPADGQICGLRMMGITFSDNKDIDTKTAAVLADCGLTEIRFDTNLTYTAEIQRSIFRENLPMYGGMVFVFLAGYLVIYNVFQISVASDIQFYGRLKTLGTTKRQIKKLIYGQGSWLSMIGIPLGLVMGYLLGIVLVPALVTLQDIQPATSASPVIFIGSALFAYVTVLTSCMLPARLAGKVSPIEALRYTDTDTSTRKKSKKTTNGASLHGMAWANLWRNRKRTAAVIGSLTLGLVLMSYFYAKNASYDLEKYLMELVVADYQIDDATNNLSSGYDPESQTINAKLLADIEALGTVEATGRLYTRQEELTLSEQTRNNLQSFYTPERLEQFATYDPSFPSWKETFDLVTNGGSCSYTIYGADGLILEAASSPGSIADGTYDAEKFATGHYCLAIGPSVSAGAMIPTYSVGETVTIQGRSFEVMAVLSPVRPMEEGVHPVFDLPLVLPADIFTELWPESNLRKYYFDIDTSISDQSLEEAYTILKNYQQGASSGMNIVSRQSIAQQYASQTRSAAVMGYAISLVIALVGLLNFINSMVTAILSRKREFAMIQSVGMTKRQLCRMLVFEGLYYAGMTLTVSYLLGALTVGVIVRSLTAGGYSTFHFTLTPLALCTPLLIIFAILIPYICFRNLEKQSVVERLRTAE